MDDRLCALQQDYRSRRDRFVSITHPSHAADPSSIYVMDVEEGASDEDVRWGEATARAARCQLAALNLAVTHATEKHLDAVVTAPWTKEIFSLIDAPQVGHTEVLAERFDAPHHVMMLAGERLPGRAHDSPYPFAASA